MITCRHMRRGIAVAGIAAGVLGVGAGTARAEESDHERAVVLFAEARKLIEAGDCPTAVVKLQESIAREPSIGARFSIADCTRDADPYGAFWHLREAALLAFVKHDDRLGSAEDQAGAIVAKTGGLRFDIDAVDLRAPGFDLRVDDRSIDRFHLAGAVALPPGDRHVIATVADGRRYEGDARVTLGQITRARIVLVRAPQPGVAARIDAPRLEPSTPVVRDDEAGLSGRRTLALAIGGSGIAALGVATAFGIVALEKRSELDRACNGDRNACTGQPRVVDPVLESADQNATVSTILFAVGGALLAGGAVLWLTDSKSPRKNAAVLRW
jgi:hypothetical protein